MDGHYPALREGDDWICFAFVGRGAQGNSCTFCLMGCELKVGEASRNAGNLG